jgi:hypothetical protein
MRKTRRSVPGQVNAKAAGDAAMFYDEDYVTAQEPVQCAWVNPEWVSISGFLPQPLDRSPMRPVK